VPGRASGVKMVGMAEMGAPISLYGWQSIQTVGVSACVIFILHQKIQKTAKCTFWYQLTQVVPDKVPRAVKWLCVFVCFDHLQNLHNQQYVNASDFRLMKANIATDKSAFRAYSIQCDRQSKLQLHSTLNTE